jgi:hypothetical protein
MKQLTSPPASARAFATWMLKVDATVPGADLIVQKLLE